MHESRERSELPSPDTAHSRVMASEFTPAIVNAFPPLPLRRFLLP